MKLFAAALALTLFMVGPSHAAERSSAAKRAFARAHPCPSTGKPIPHCPGHLIDHVIPLCAGGADSAANMQWQTFLASYRKDARERAYCRCLKVSGKTCSFKP